MLIAGIAHKYICYEVWSRETGHMWNTYSPFHRTPTEKEMDFADLDATGRPSIKWDDFDSRPEESSAEPQVGDSWTYEQYGKLYSKTITFVHFRGMVYEDTEGYDVEYYEKEL